MYKINQEKLLICLMFVLTIVISLAPFFNIGFTTADDLENYMSLKKHMLFSEAWIYTKNAGRFYFIITKPLYSLPYIGDSFLLTKIIQIFSLLLSYSLFAILIKKLFNSKELALVLFLLLVMATSASENFHIPFIAYPFYFTFSFSILICSFLLFFKYTETQKYKYVIFSAIVLFIAILFYETYLVFLLFFCFYIFFKNLSSSKSLKKLLKSNTFYKELIPIVSAAVLYVLLYFGFRLMFLNETEIYHGSSFAKNFSFANYFSLITNLTKTILPTNLYHLSQNYIIQNSLSSGGHINNFWHILQNSNLLSIINTIIQMALFVFIALRFNKNISYKKILIGILVAFLFTISAHSILGLSEKYNAIENATIKGYVTSYFAYFGVWLIILLMSYLLIKLTHKIKYIKYAVIVVLSLGLGYVSIITSYSNDHLSRGWKKSQLRFTLLDDLLKEGAFDNVENGSIIYSPEIQNSDPLGGLLAEQDFDWATYIQLKSQRDFYVAKNPKNLTLLAEQNPEAKIYRFIKTHTQKNTNFMFVIAEINKSTINFESMEDQFITATCNKADIHYYSPTKDFMFSFYPKNSENKTAIINNCDYIKLNNGYNQININNINKNDKISSFSIKSEVEIYSEMFSITNMITNYTNKINIVDNNKILTNYYSLTDTLIVVESTNPYPIGFIPLTSLESAYSAISLSVNLEISNQQKDNKIQIITEIRDDQNEIIYWTSHVYYDIPIIDFNEIIILDDLKQYKPSYLKFFLWNSEACEFTIKKINNASIKII
ncbi:MAG: hypothetical protein PHP52_07690 [Bacteroidales bacterium]|nr:hypothetical protein [Bacteroidales bacterium]MDD4216196.1 hypothetical protein [Bacteroidales bacterium]MDY0141536.1 hypothetical protein [Bacteroidales bacterium]